MTRPALQLPRRRRPRSVVHRALALAMLGVSIVAGVSIAVHASLDDPDMWNQDRLASMSSAQIAAARDRTQQRMLTGAGVFLCGPLLVGVGAVARSVVRRLRPARGTCHVCRYNVRFNHLGVCPECGSPASGSRRRSAPATLAGGGSGGPAMLPFYIVPPGPIRQGTATGSIAARSATTPQRATGTRIQS